MSHGPQREDKNCLNCGTTVIGRYCHICGQENLEPKETVWHLVSHFFNDITHFDGKFFQTLKILLFRPGFLSEEYVKGKRASYLNPIRMYVFTSAIFFLLFFSFFNKEEGLKMSVNGKTLTQISDMDSLSFARFTSTLNNGKPMTRQEFQNYVDTAFATNIHIGNGGRYKTRKEYDSVLAAGKIKDGWLERQFVYKSIAINNKYHHNSQEIANAFIHALFHSLPQMLFLSLPLLALILKLLYVRRRKQFYYVSHGIFSIHLYIFVFIALLVLFTLSSINNNIHWKSLSTLSTILAVGIFVYEYVAIKNFYKQGLIKTFFKFLLIDIFFLIVLGLSFILFLLFSFFNI
ncbi:MAG TPA: DUF3667 domain-containing protein [Chitinophagaceae bacterium]